MYEREADDLPALPWYAVVFTVTIMFIVFFGLASIFIKEPFMARSNYIYLVHPKGSNEPVVATFTVKHESQTWAEQSQHGIENLERTRMKDGGDSKFISTRVACPWE